MKEMEDYCNALIMLDGGESKPVIAFINDDGTLGGCCEPYYLKKSEQFGQNHKLTTNGKYTRCVCGIISSKEL